jgi:hypothetical protein
MDRLIFRATMNMEIATRRFLLRDFMESDRSPFLDDNYPSRENRHFCFLYPSPVTLENLKSHSIDITGSDQSIDRSVTNSFNFQPPQF